MRLLLLSSLFLVACDGTVTGEPQCEADDDCRNGQICQLPECICVDAPGDASTPQLDASMPEPDASTPEPEPDAATPAPSPDAG